MDTPAQDTDSGTGAVVTPGEPVDHIDMVDGQSAGSIIEPGDTVPAEPKPGDTASEKPPGLSRDDIYAKAQQNRSDSTEEALAGMTPTERADYYRMVAEASGVTDEAQDPFDGDGNIKKGWIDPGAPPAAAASPDQAPVPAGEPIAQDVSPPIDPASEMVSIVVYGMKQEVPRAEVDAAGGVANFQKNLAADERMKRASTYEASVRALDQEVSTRLNSLQEQERSPQASDTTADQGLPPTGAPDETVDTKAAAERLVGAMYSGDREAAITEAAEVLASFKQDVTRAAQQQVGQPGAPTVTPAEQQVALDRAAAAEAERLEANQVFVSEYKDLQSPVLRAATLAMVQTVAAEPIMYGRPLAEVTREAGTRVRSDVFGTQPKPIADPAPPVAPTNVAPTDLQTRMALKSRTVVQPLIQATGRFVDPPANEQRPETNKEYISRMKVEQRGQHG